MIYRGFASVFKSFFYNYHAESLIDILPFFLSFVCIVTWFQISLLKYSQTAGPYVRHQASNAEIENRWIFRFENEILSWKVRQQWVSLRSHLTKRLRAKTSKVLMNIASYTPFLCVIEYSIAFVSLLCALLDSKRNKSPKWTVLRFPVWKVLCYSISRFASRICYARGILVLSNWFRANLWDQGIELVSRVVNCRPLSRLMDCGVDFVKHLNSPEIHWKFAIISCIYLFRWCNL